MTINAIHELFESLIRIQFADRRNTLDRLRALAKQMDSPDSLAAYLNSDSRLVRLFATDALGVINHDNSVVYLVNLMDKERDKEIQMSAVYSLVNITRMSALEALLKIASNPKYSKLVQTLAIQSVAVSTIKTVLTPMFEILQKADSARNFAVIESVFDAFDILIDDEKGIPKRLDELLRSENTSDPVLLYCIVYLGERRYVDSADAILPYLDSQDSDLRHAAISALGNLGLPRYIENLESIQDDQDSRIRDAVEESLHKLRY